MNIGVIRGGTMPNIVPDLAEVEIDVRVTPALAANGGGIERLKNFLMRHELPLTISKAHENPPMEIAADHPMIVRLLECSAGSSRLVGAPWFSDAAHLAAGGLPSICMGPGSIDQAHTKDEWIEIESLRQGAEFFYRWIARFAS